MGVWVDPRTSLMWELKEKKGVNDEYSMQEALLYCETLNVQQWGGFTDWRLPTLEELKSVGVVEFFEYAGNHKAWKEWYEAHTEGLIGGYFILPELSQEIGLHGWYWSCTPKSDKEYYLINYKDGNTNFHEAHQQFYIRCVRG